MKFAEACPAALILALRLVLVSPRAWAGDWIAVLALLWIAFVFTEEKPKLRAGSLVLSCAWLVVIYAIHQGPWTFGLKP